MSRSGPKPPSVLLVAVRFVVVLLPVVLLALATLRANAEGKPNELLLLGSAFQAVLSVVLFHSVQRWRQPLGTPAFILYVSALAFVWMGMRKAGLDDWYFQMAQATLLVVSMALLAVQILSDSSARELHYACTLAQRLAERKDWPDSLESCRSLPEVKALREAIHNDASPAFALLGNERPQVRLAALAALEFRRDWRPGQAELVIAVAKRAEEPAVRAAAVSALANFDNRLMVERLAEFFSDPSPTVRKAASEVLLWDSDRRWPWLRQAVRESLSNPAHQDDGPLVGQGQMLSEEAVKDLNAWISEKGILAVRSVLTLMVHYERVLNERQDDKLQGQLKKQVVDPRTPAILRIELANLLQSNNLLSRDLQEKLLDPMNPAPLRMIAADALLANGRHAGAVTALKDVARMPNREIAVATADIVQRRLNIDMGLALAQPLPALNTRQAADVTRKVMQWARSGDAADDKAAEAVEHFR